MLRPLFTAWHACAEKLGDVELTAKLLVEMIAYGADQYSLMSLPRCRCSLTGDANEPGCLQDDLLAVLRVSLCSGSSCNVLIIYCFRALSHHP